MAAPNKVYPLVSARVDADTLDRLRYAAEKAKVPLSTYLREIIKTDVALVFKDEADAALLSAQQRSVSISERS